MRETRCFEPEEKCSYLPFMIPDEFFTIDKEVESELREKASRFLAIAFPAVSRQEAENRLFEIRKKYHDATHHCFGYKILEKDLIERSSDDGEPSGTGGRPILQAIGKFKFYNVCVVVNRWFGGTKLGTGGLVRAYGGAAYDALQHAVLRRCETGAMVDVQFPHNMTNGVMHTIAQFGAKIHSNRFEEDATITVLLRNKDVASFASSIVEATRGEARVRIGTEHIIIG